MNKYILAAIIVGIMVILFWRTVLNLSWPDVAACLLLGLLIAALGWFILIGRL